jgi:hypothetical protein
MLSETEFKMEWKELYPKSNKPLIAEIEKYLKPDVFDLFKEFNAVLKSSFGFGFILPKYTETKGWVYQYGYSGFLFVKNVYFHDGIFNSEKTDIADKEALQKAIESIRIRYDREFKEKYGAFAEKRNAKQRERAQSYKERQEKAIKENEAIINKDKFNVYSWSPRLPLNKLRQLYESDAKGIKDIELADEVGFSMYSRCVQGLDKCDLRNKGKFRCLHCGSVLDIHGLDEVVTCGCGYQYTQRAFNKSFYQSMLPHGAATEFFREFIKDWENAKEYSEKMLAVDKLIHSFHTSMFTGSGYKTVGVNLLQGTRAQIKELILSLAYKK